MDKGRSSSQHYAELELLPHPKQKRCNNKIRVAWSRWRWRHVRRFLRRHPFVIWVFKYTPVVIVAFLAFTAIAFPSYTRPPAHYKQLAARCQGDRSEPGCANAHNETIFISIILYDGDGSFAGGIWGDRIITLVNFLGPDHVFLSIYESDSGLVGQKALETFRQRVPCRHEIVSDEKYNMDALPRTYLPNGAERIKRIALLSELRNRALRPLDRFEPDKGLPRYDKILFLNDIAFHPIDAAHLLFNTNRGPDGRAHYLAACALDYLTPLHYYDLYATRDADGFPVYMNEYPIFMQYGRALSQHDMLSQTDHVRVKSCWGGMMAVQAQYVQNTQPNSQLPRQDFQALSGQVMDPRKPRQATAPVRFRFEPDPYFDSCECCLFLADISTVAAQEKASEQSIYVNPYIRVAYAEPVLHALPWVRRWERLFAIPHFIREFFEPPKLNPYRTVQQGEHFEEEVWNGTEWTIERRVGRSGLFCGVRDMQVLRPERVDGQGWVNTFVPPGQRHEFKTVWGKLLNEGWRKEYAAATGREKEEFFEWMDQPR